MIELLENLPENVIGIVARERITSEDYDRVVIPAVEAALAKFPKVRCYYEIDSPFGGMEAGAAWRDLSLGVRHWSAWERVALVTDVQWIAGAMNALGFFLPGDMRVFPTSQAQAARDWIVLP